MNEAREHLRNEIQAYHNMMSHDYHTLPHDYHTTYCM